MKWGLILTVLFFTCNLFSDPLSEKYKKRAELIAKLYQEITKLEVILTQQGFEAFQDEWKELYEKKLLPQINTVPSLIIADTGGTNTGKSSIYNYLLNADMSSVSESAGHTKHSTLSTHPDDFDREGIQKLYSRLKILQDALPGEAAAEKGQTHDLLVKVSNLLPKNFILIDTPDIDSNNKNNWTKAYDIARSADVVIAVLSDDKYINDQVVEFYKLLKQSGKPIIVVINKVTDEEISEKYPETWLKEFCLAVDNLVPLRAYTVVRSIKDVKARTLRFLELDPKTHKFVKEIERNPETGQIIGNVDLRKEAHALDVNTLRTQALEGALNFALNGNGSTSIGVKGSLQKVEARAKLYQGFYKSLETDAVLQNLNWPTIPPAILFSIIQNWLDKSEHRTDWARNIEYYTKWLELPFRFAINTFLKDPKKEVLDAFRKEENLMIDEIVNTYFAIFDPILKEEKLLSLEAKKLLNPSAVTTIISKIRKKHAKDSQLQQDLEVLLSQFITGWGKDHPKTIELIKLMDAGYNTAKVATALTLPFGNLLQGSLTAGVGTYLVGASATSQTFQMGKKMASESPIGVNWVFEDIVNEYKRINILWVLQQLQTEFAPILLEIRQGSEVTQSESYKEARSCLDALLLPL